MLVSHEHKFVMVAVPKTGSTSMHYSLSDAMGVEFESKSGAPAVYHMYASDMKYLMGKAWDDYSSFAMVRNPYDRLVSLYHDFKFSRGFIKAETFEIFIKHRLMKNWLHDIHFKPQHEFVTSDAGELIVSEIARYEDGVQQALNSVCKRCGLGQFEVGHQRKTDRKGFSEYFTDREMLDIVNKVYDKDFGLFGYYKL